MGIATTIPTNLNFPNRGVLERDDFVNAQETAQDLLAGAYTTALNQYATELNDTEADINLKWEQVKSQAVTGGYSQAYIDATFTPKILNTQTAKTTPVDADLIPLSDSVASFGLKKLSWANLKTTLKTYFDTLYLALTGNQSIDGVKTFTSSPIIPTAPAQDNSTKAATTAYVDGKMVIGTAVTASGTAIDFTSIPTWTKKIIVMFNAVSTNGASIVNLQIGSGSISTTGYITTGTAFAGSSTGSLSGTSGFVFGDGNLATYAFSGKIELVKLSGNTWVATGGGYRNSAGAFILSGASPSLAGSLDRIRITTVSGTDVFDSGSINIMYEG